MVPKPILSAWQVCKTCLGAFGIQFGFALRMSTELIIRESCGA